MSSEQLKSQVLHIVDTLENPPMVDCDGTLLPDDATAVDAQNGIEYVTRWDRKVPHKDAQSHLYSYDEEADTWTCVSSGQTWSGIDCDGGYAWTPEDDLILGGRQIADVQPMSAFDYLSDALDIEYRVGSDKEYRSAEVLVACGGPNVWIDTKRNMVVGAWWGDRFEAPFSDEIGLDDACEELFGC